MQDSNFREPKFRLSRAATAAGFSLNTLRSNYQRGWFRSFAGALGTGQGRAQRLCLGDVIVLAIARRLVDLRIHPVEAFNAAYAFGLVAKQYPHVPRRPPFELFDPARFRTVFAWKPGTTAQILPVARGGGVPLEQLKLLDGEGTICLLLNPIVEDVFEKLGSAAAADGRNG